MTVTREREIRDKLTRALASAVILQLPHANLDAFALDHAKGMAMEIEDCLVILDEMEGIE